MSDHVDESIVHLDCGVGGGGELQAIFSKAGQVSPVGGKISHQISEKTTRVTPDLSRVSSSFLVLPTLDF